LDPVNLPTHTASRSNWPFFHNTPDRHTDRPTDWIDSIDYSDMANNMNLFCNVHSDEDLMLEALATLVLDVLLLTDLGYGITD